jgi:hypothetical protein
LNQSEAAADDAVEFCETLSSAAKAGSLFVALSGTTEVVPFQGSERANGNETRFEKQNLGTQL